MKKLFEMKKQLTKEPEKEQLKTMEQSKVKIIKWFNYCSSCDEKYDLLKKLDNICKHTNRFKLVVSPNSFKKHNKKIDERIKKIDGFETGIHLQFRHFMTIVDYTSMIEYTYDELRELNEDQLIKEFDSNN